MNANAFREKGFSTLPYDKSAPVTFTVYAAPPAEEDDTSTISLVTTTNELDPGNFVFSLFPLNFSQTAQYKMSYGDAKLGLDACQFSVEWNQIQITYPDSLPKNTLAITLSANIWWATGVTAIGFRASTELQALVSFNGEGKVLNKDNHIYFPV
jgi:hypothetical protein